MAALFLSITAVSFGQGGGAGAGSGGAGVGAGGGAGIGASGSDGAAGANSGNSSMGASEQGSNTGKPGAAQTKAHPNKVEMVIDFFKNLDVFEVTEKEESTLLENSWNDNPPDPDH